MSSRLRVAAAAVALAACGGEAKRSVTLARTYDVSGAGRVLPDGFTPRRITAVSLVLDELVVEGTAVRGVVQRKGGAARAFRGELDAALGTLHIVPFEADLTGTATEAVEQIGGRIFESLPADGVGDELSMFLHTPGFDGSLIGISRAPSRPDRPDDRLLAIEGGRVVGRAGAVAERAAVEVYAFDLAKRDPRYVITQADDQGAFGVAVAAEPETMIFARARVAGIPSDLRLVPR